ncbi:MAG: hypothetical protein E7582_05860 [Ruminococcaceae bacterium]|nr:hypothetical protein [Oscillospiraceae bacterium]
MKRLYPYLDEALCKVLKGLPEEVKREVCEVRLRVGGATSLSTYSKNLFVTPDSKITNNPKKARVSTFQEVANAVTRLCEGSVYRYMSTLNSGYIVTRDGIRTGVCGQATSEKEKIISVTNFTSLNMRLHKEIENAGDSLANFISKNQGTSLLIFSPPGVGKTTVIRSIAKSLATGKFSRPMRVSVIDERGEILPSGSVGLIDRFLGYSKPDGIEIAVRLFSPEYIVCDEIGLQDDTKAMLSVQNSGVPFIATTHARNINELIKRPNIMELIKHQVFNSYARLEKSENGCSVVFEELNS